MDFSGLDFFADESAQDRAFFSGILEGIGKGVVVIDKEYRILTANRGYMNQVRREVFLKLRVLDSRATIILSSGCNRDRDADDLLKQGADAFIQKPYRITDLVRVVDEAITKKKAGPALVSQGSESNCNENRRQDSLFIT